YTARFDKVTLDKIVEHVADLPDPEHHRYCSSGTVASQYFLSGDPLSVGLTRAWGLLLLVQGCIPSST
ncbi:hypothetical protein Taro_034419, partial [Colocasia esculenta]|nr:hypothetical protein [Colocasia esculenta]